MSNLSQMKSRAALDLQAHCKDLIKRVATPEQAKEIEELNNTIPCQPNRGVPYRPTSRSMISYDKQRGEA